MELQTILLDKPVPCSGCGEKIANPQRLAYLVLIGPSDSEFGANVYAVVHHEHYSRMCLRKFAPNLALEMGL